MKRIDPRIGSIICIFFLAIGSVQAMVLEPPEAEAPESSPEYWYGGSEVPPIVDRGGSEAENISGEEFIGDEDELVEAATADIPRAGAEADSEGFDMLPEENIEKALDEDMSLDLSDVPEEETKKGKVTKTEITETNEKKTKELKKAETDQEVVLQDVVARKLAEELDSVSKALSPIVDRWVDELGVYIKGAVQLWVREIQQYTAQKENAEEISMEDAQRDESF